MEEKKGLDKHKNMMKSKEKILEKHFGNYAYKFGGSGTVDLFMSMDEYSEVVAIDFAKWIDKNIYTFGLNKKWYKIPPVLKGEKSEYTTEELFELYKKENKL